MGDGKGGPGYLLDGEFPNQGPRFDHRGAVGMSNAGPRTDGSQFFIAFQAAGWLDGKHTIFGEVVDSEAALAALEGAGTRSGTPSTPLVIERAELIVD